MNRQQFPSNIYKILHVLNNQTFKPISDNIELYVRPSGEYPFHMYVIRKYGKVFMLATDGLLNMEDIHCLVNMSYFEDDDWFVIFYRKKVHKVGYFTFTNRPEYELNSKLKAILGGFGPIHRQGKMDYYEVDSDDYLSDFDLPYV